MFSMIKCVFNERTKIFHQQSSVRPLSPPRHDTLRVCPVHMGTRRARLCSLAACSLRALPTAHRLRPTMPAAPASPRQYQLTSPRLRCLSSATTSHSTLQRLLPLDNMLIRHDTYHIFEEAFQYNPFVTILRYF